MSQSTGVGAGETESSSVDDPSASQTPVASSGNSNFSPPPAPLPCKAAPTPAARKTKESLELYCDRPGCPKSKKPYKTQAGYNKHILAHKVSDCSGRVPTVAEFNGISHELMRKVISDIATEPKLRCPEQENQKAALIREISENASAQEKWERFVTSLSDPVVKSLVGPSKILPQNRYEEALMILNKNLNKEEVMSDLCVSLTEISDVLTVKLARRLIFRFSHLLLDHMQSFIAKEMRGPEPIPPAPVRGIDRQDFDEVVSSLLRGFLKKGQKRAPDSKMWRSVCRCLKEKFVSEAVTTDQFLNKDCWQSNDPASIKLSENTSSFFLCVENCILRNDEQAGAGHRIFLTVDETLPLIFNNRDAMSMWFNLTKDFFSEENSMYVMKLMVSSYRELSIVLEEKLRNSLAVKGRSTVAVRTNLKRD